MRVRSCVRACVTALLLFGLRACFSLEDEDDIKPPGGAQLWVQEELKTPGGGAGLRIQEELKTPNGREEQRVQELKNPDEGAGLRVQEELKTPDGGEELRVQVSGRALVPGVRAEDWISSARVLLDGEKHVGFLRDDGSFTVSGVPSGSYVLEVSSPTYRFQPVRVDVSSAGKMRARVLNYIQTSEVILLPYPLQMRSAGPHTFFVERESWGWADFILNPMVLMMVLPLLVILLLPRVFNPSDPEMRREIEQSMNMLNSNQELPDVSEIMTKIFSPAKGHGRVGGGARSQRGGAQGQRGGAPRRR